MSSIDKRALRKAAEQAGADEWCAFIDTKSKTYSVHTPGDNRCGDVVKWAGFDGQQRAAAKAKFISAANPATVLTLLDELEPMALAHLNLNLLCAVYRSAYEEARHDGLVNWEAAASLAEENEELKRKLEAAEKRIAELAAAAGKGE